MKRIFALFTILLLTACSSPAGKAVGQLGKKVKQCCTTVCIKKDKEGSCDASPLSISSSEKTILPELPASLQEVVSSEMLTW